jgi:hypothetical protein
MSQYLMDKEIADLYERIEFPEASKIYEQKMKENITKEIQIVEPTLPWYKAIFE